ncbi:LAFA_0F21154g1_1 [Lachancea sp. 'fantastica']|nr:LAFA_0F21154g1_1 [Lachancea sp. 'fantastica']
MSKVEEELPTTISEDFGFKPLGQIELLPGFNENVPFSKLHGLSVSNQKGLYAAAGGGKVVVGELQNLREQVLQETDEKKTLRFILEETAENVVYVGFNGTAETTVIWITRSGVFHRFDLAKKEITQVTIKNAESDAMSQVAKVQRLSGPNESFLVLYNSGRLFAVTETGNATLAAENVCDFDVGRANWALFTLDGSLEVYEKGEITSKKAIELPNEIRDELNESLQPLSVLSLSQNQFVVVLGNAVNESDEDAEYDQKVYVVSKNENDEVSFRESFDIAPAFGSVLRKPTYYKCVLDDLMETIPQLYIVASATSPEITILDKDEVLQPNQDSDRAVLPMNQETDNDTNPIGLAVDLTSSEQIPEPCQGVEFATKLPLVLVLNNEGRLSIFALFHSSGIKSQQFSAKLSDKSLESVTNFEPRISSDDFEDQSINLSSSADETTMSASENLNKGEDDKTVFSGQPDNRSTFTPATSTFGQSSSSQPPFGVKPAAFGQTNSTNSAFNFGTNSKDSSSSAFGNIAFPFGESNNSAFGQSPFSLKVKNSGEDASIAAKDQSSIPNSTAGTPAFGMSTFGRPNFGTKIGSEKPIESGAFKTPFFSAPSNSSSPFKSALDKNGSANLSQESGSGTGFASFAASGSPFTNLTKSSSPFGTPPFPSNPDAASDVTRSPFAFGTQKLPSGSTQSPFSQLKNSFDNKAPGPSPFASLNSTASGGRADSKDDDTGAGSGKSDKFDSAVHHEDSKSFTEEISGSSSSGASVSNESENSASEDSRSNSSADDMTGGITEKDGKESKPSTGEAASDFSTLTERIKRAAANNSEIIHEPSSVEDTRQSDHPGTASSAFSKYTETFGKGAAPAFSFASIGKQQASSGDHSNSWTSEKKEEGNEEEEKASGLQTSENLGDISSIGDGTKTLASTASSETVTRDPDLRNKTINETETAGTSQEGQVEDDEENQSPNEGSESNVLQVSNQVDDNSEISSDTDRKIGASEEKVEEIVAQKSDKEYSSATSDEDSPVNVAGSEKTAKNSSASTENESFDELEDLKEELDQIKTGEEKIGKSVTRDSAVEPHVWSIDETSQTQEVETSSNGTQTQIHVEDAAVATDSIELKDIDVQSFEDDEAYQAQQYKPKPSSPFYTGAKLAPVKSKHTNATLNRIEVTFSVVSAEIDVLETNLRNIGLLMSDQSSKPFARTRKTLYQTYTWRLAEVEELNSIVDSLLAEAQSTGGKATALSSGTQGMREKDLEQLEKYRFFARRQFIQLHELYTESSSDERGLTLNQTQMQHKLRTQILSAQKRVQSIEDTLRLLKSHFSKDDITKAPMITKIVTESKKRGDLLEAIQLLRKEVAELKLKDNDFSKLSDAERASQTVPITEMKLKFDTKRQLGEFFKRKNSNLT